jgi:hypothetical protein
MIIHLSLRWRKLAERLLGVERTATVSSSEAKFDSIISNKRSNVKRTRDGFLGEGSSRSTACRSAE